MEAAILIIDSFFLGSFDTKLVSTPGAGHFQKKQNYDDGNYYDPIVKHPIYPVSFVVAAAAGAGAGAASGVVVVVTTRRGCMAWSRTIGRSCRSDPKSA